MTTQPKPKHIVTVCDICELPWDTHGKNPTVETCVKLLAAELKKKQTTPNYVFPFTVHTCARCGAYVNGYHNCSNYWQGGGIIGTAVRPQITYTTTTTNTAQSGVIDAISQLKSQLTSA